MATFKVTDPSTGRTLNLTGDSPPSQEELTQLFAQFNDVPTPENLAVPAPGSPDRTIGENIIGAGEALLTLATGATGGALGFLASAPQAAIGELTGELEPGEGFENASEMAARLTFAPRTEAGQEFVSDIASTLGVLPPILGTTPLNTLRPLVTGKAITAKILKNPRAKRALLAEEIRKGNPNIETVTKALDESGAIITRPASVKALKVLGGDDAAKRTISLMENMDPATKAQTKKMVGVIERGNRDPLFRNENRPSDVLGKSILNRARAVTNLNEKASKNIGLVAKSLEDVTVDISKSTDQFFNQLGALGVTFKQGDDGWVTPDFSRSKFSGGSQQHMTVLVNDLLNRTPDFNTAHELKQIIRTNLDYDVGGVGQIKGGSQRIMKSLASGIDETLDSTSPAYNAANQRFSKTIDLKNEFDNLAGKDIDIKSDLAAKSLGGKAMRFLSKAESRVAIQKTLNNADKVLKELGVNFKDDPASLIHMVSEFENIFKLAPSGSLKGNVVSGGLEVAESLTSPMAAIRAAGRQLDKLSATDFNKRVRAIKTVLNEGGK